MKIRRKRENEIRYFVFSYFSYFFYDGRRPLGTSSAVRNLYEKYDISKYEIFFTTQKKLQKEFRRNSKGFVFRFRDLVFRNVVFFVQISHGGRRPLDYRLKTPRKVKYGFQKKNLRVRSAAQKNSAFHRFHCIFAMQNISVYFIAFDRPKKTRYPSECRVLHIRLFTVFRIMLYFPETLHSEMQSFKTPFLPNGALEATSYAGT